MAMPGGGMGPMPPQQQSMMSPHQQQHMAAQQHAAAQAAAAAAQAAAQQAQQQSHQGPPQTNQLLQGPPQPGAPTSGAQQAEQQRVDNISKAKSLIPNLKESMLNVLRNAALAVQANNMIDSGTKQVDYDVSRFDKSFEEFFSLLDQIEKDLKTSVECLNQNGQSAKYLPVPVTPTKTDSQSMTYAQYIDLVKGQIAYAKEIHGALTDASQRLSD